MATCNLQQYQVGAVKAGKYVFERQIRLSSDYKSLELVHLTDPQKNCEVSIDGTEVGFIIQNDLLLFQNPSNKNACIFQFQVDPTANYPKMSLKMERKTVAGIEATHVIGVEDIRFGLQTVTSTHANAGFTLAFYTPGGGTPPYVELKVWAP
ncbi:MAG: hypothetical protein AAFP77_07505 [Bacteroidota bacterium]